MRADLKRFEGAKPNQTRLHKPGPRLLPAVAAPTAGAPPQLNSTGSSAVVCRGGEGNTNGVLFRNCGGRTDRFWLRPFFGVYSLLHRTSGAHFQNFTITQVTNSGKAGLTAHFAGWKIRADGDQQQRTAGSVACTTFRLAATRK